MKAFIAILVGTLCFSSAFPKDPPPAAIPPELYNAFTLNGRIPVAYHYSDDSYSSDTPLIYSTDALEGLIRQVKDKTLCYYGTTGGWLCAALEKYIHHISGKKIAIMGSAMPYCEAIVLAYQGCPTTIEYNKIISTDPRLEVLTVQEYEANPKTFDAMLSISSFEHDGLGRYGDPINPNGDLIAMKKARKMLDPEGLLFLAVPIGADCLTWNLHRIYGEIRLRLLLRGWEIVETFGFTQNDFRRGFGDWTHQPVFVLRPVQEARR